MFLYGSVVEHCVSSAKGCGLDSQGSHILCPPTSKLVHSCIHHKDIQTGKQVCLQLSTPDCIYSIYSTVPYHITLSHVLYCKLASATFETKNCSFVEHTVQYIAVYHWDVTVQYTVCILYWKSSIELMSFVTFQYFHFWFLWKPFVRKKKQNKNCKCCIELHRMLIDELNKNWKLKTAVFYITYTSVLLLI